MSIKLKEKRICTKRKRGTESNRIPSIVLPLQGRCVYFAAEVPRVSPNATPVFVKFTCFCSWTLMRYLFLFLFIINLLSLT